MNVDLTIKFSSTVMAKENQGKRKLCKGHSKFFCEGISALFFLLTNNVVQSYDSVFSIFSSNGTFELWQWQAMKGTIFY